MFLKKQHNKNIRYGSLTYLGIPPCHMVRPWGFMQAWEPAPHHHTMRQGGIWFALPSLGKDALISNDGAHTLTAEAAVAVAAPVGAAREEVEAVGAVRVVWAPRRRPVLAVLTSVVEAAVPAAASRQEDAIAIDIAGELPAVHTIERCPFACAVIKQLIDIVQGGHTPVATPFYMGNVVFRTADI